MKVNYEMQPGPKSPQKVPDDRSGPKSPHFAEYQGCGLQVRQLEIKYKKAAERLRLAYNYHLWPASGLSFRI